MAGKENIIVELLSTIYDARMKPVILIAVIVEVTIACGLRIGGYDYGDYKQAFTAKSALQYSTCALAALKAYFTFSVITG